MAADYHLFLEDKIYVKMLLIAQLQTNVSALRYIMLQVSINKLV